MENFFNKTQENKQFGLGVIIVAIGGLLLLRNIGLALPHWIFSWHTLMLAGGIWLGYRKNFQGNGWLALTIIGGIFTAKDIFFFNFSAISGSLVLVAVGLYLILNPKKAYQDPSFGPKKTADFTDSTF